MGVTLSPHKHPVCPPCSVTWQLWQSVNHYQVQSQEAEGMMAALHQFARLYTDPMELGKDISDSVKLRVMALGSAGFQRT